MANGEYWKNRALDRVLAAEDIASERMKRIRAAYIRALKSIREDAKRLVKAFAASGEIPEEYARELISEAANYELNAVLTRLMRDTKDGDAKREVWLRLRASAYRYRADRFQLLEDRIYSYVKEAANVEIAEDTELFSDIYERGYYSSVDAISRQYGRYIEDFTLLPKSAVEAAVAEPWSGAHFSTRVWANTDKVAKAASEIVTAGLLSGEGTAKMAKKLESAVNSGIYAAERLVRTETLHFLNKGQLDSYIEYGDEEYEYLATLDARTCQTCGALDMKVFPVSAAQEGVNYPTMHPNCRCTTVPHVDANGTRRARNYLTGEYDEVSGNMSYSEWISSMSPEERAEFEYKAKSLQNRAADKRQLAKYQEVLGKKGSLRGLDKFQRVKYNSDKELINFIRLDYSRQKKLLDDPELALPNAAVATADSRKFTNYLFDETKSTGYAKGRAFTSRLGYDKDNYSELKKAILEGAKKYPATFKGTDQFGDKYEQKMVLYGKKDKPANVIIGWKTKDGKTWMTSAYIKEIDR